MSAFAKNGCDLITAAGSDPDAREAYYAVEFLTDATIIVFDHHDSIGNVRADATRTRDAGAFLYLGFATKMRVTAGSIEAYRVYPFTAFT